MTAKLLTILLTLGTVCAACAYDSDPATPDEYAARDFREVAEEVRAAQENAADAGLTPEFTSCVQAELATLIGAGEITQNEFTLWSQGASTGGPVQDAIDRIVEEEVC